MINAPVTLYWRPTLLDQTIAWLDQHGYQIVQLDAARWETEDDLHRDVADAFDFPDYYGHNLDALRDCMSDVTDGEYGWNTDRTGLVVVFRGYDRFARSCPRAAQLVLDIIAEQSRTALLFGRRVMCLVQSDDPDIRLTPVGATPAAWNDAEWLDSARHPDR
ncbi:barstar family protein [Plantactinospora sp. KBS50]|uniref:barstar family protein n=1 Tax=Plantactinospora sp. KBS50 TaxID=2024580 RepID=UPI000BAB0579|nr:barstar family protein [Plantactinospora sp. KBS50]ASW55752.1 barnase inhibitor [Plantactinospora sp. KBS50]